MTMYFIGAGRLAGVSKIIEEAGELLEIIGKVQGSKGMFTHWTGHLERKLYEEVADVYAALDFFMSHDGLKWVQAVNERRAKKLAMFKDWHHNTQFDEKRERERYTDRAVRQAAELCLAEFRGDGAQDESVQVVARAALRLLDEKEEES